MNKPQCRIILNDSTFLQTFLDFDKRIGVPWVFLFPVFVNFFLLVASVVILSRILNKLFSWIATEYVPNSCRLG